jgi:glucokinase-like ROK family protein
MRSGTNLPRVRHYNESVVLEAIRVGDGVSRVEIAQRTGLTAQTVSNIVKRLLNMGLVAEGGTTRSKGGRRRVTLRINPHATYAVGVQVDGEETCFVIIDLAGRVAVRTRHPTHAHRGPFAIIDQIAESVTQLVEEANVTPDKILGLGVACPGPLDHRRGIVYEPPNLPGWHEVPLAEALNSKTGYPVLVDNDATAAAIGERWAGGAGGTRNFAFVYMGVGVGAGIFLEDHVYRGSTTNAGEFGHMILNPDGPSCTCGSHGCVEAYCAPRSVLAAVSRRLSDGEPSVIAAHAAGDGGRIDFGAICKAARTGDDLAMEEIRRSAQWLGFGVVSLVNLLDVELVVLGGSGFRDADDIYRDEVQRVVDERIIARDRRTLRVQLSMAGEDAGAVGAASLVLEATYAPRLDVLSRTRVVAAGD